MSIVGQIEQLRQEAYTLIQSGLATETALAAAAGITQPHLSAFISNRRNLSPRTADALRAAVSAFQFPLAA